MARISLRAYTQEVEGLIENGRIDQAVAHSLHILQVFPKHLDTYRLLGKAFLESQRFADASDIFKRLLSSIPEDFVAQVGMSIIREDEGNLDEALWHMERAFEVQPANSAIQEELRRLYARRDGYEPPKVRLTRPALARMYARGDLYQQAIAELRAALADEPERLDLQGMLASVYARSGQEVEAVDLANALVRKLPYHLEANRILAEAMQKSDKTEQAAVYRQRVIEMEPYSAYLSPTAPTPDKVPSQTVMLDKLDWQAQQAQSSNNQPTWAASLGVEVEDFHTEQEEETMPAWLQETGQEAPVSEEAESGETEQVPDWMQEAGWGPSSGTAEETAGEQEEASTAELESDQAESSLEEADIPDWLQAIAPDSGEESPEQVDQLTGLDWMEEPDDDGNLPDWLKEEGETQDALEEPFIQGRDADEEEDEDLQAWLASREIPPEEDEGEESAPDWLQEFKDEVGEVEELEGEDWLHEVAGESEEDLEAELPDWLREEEEEDSQTASAEIQDELTEAEPDGSAEELVTDEEVPDWLKDAVESVQQETAPVEAAEVEMETTPASEDLPDWLHEFEPQAESDVEAEMPQAESEAALPAEEIPAWLQEAKPAAELEADTSEEEAFAETEEDMDEAYAWLEGLAVKQGAEEALLLDEDQRRETPPDWVAEAEQDSVTEQGIEQQEVESAEPIVEAQMESGFSEMVGTPEETEVSQSEEVAGVAAASAYDLSSELPVEEEDTQPVRVSEQEPASIDTELAGAPVEGEEETIPLGLEEITPNEQLPEWLRELKPISEEAPQEAEAIDEDIPEWLFEPESAEETSEAAPETAAEIEVDEEAAFAWLESLAVKQGAEEALLLDEDQRRETPPDWVAEAGREAELTTEQAPVEGQLEQQTAEPGAEQAASLEEPASVEAELEMQAETPASVVHTPNLGATHTEAAEAEAEQPEVPAPESAVEAEAEAVAAEAGIQPELEAGAEPETASEQMPEWLAGLFDEEDTKPVRVRPAEPETPEEEEPGVEMMATEETPAWLHPSEAEESQALEQQQQPPQEEELPEEVLTEVEAGATEEAALEASGETEEETPAAAGASEEAEALAEMDDEAAFAWLESLAVKQGAEEALLLDEDQRRETPPDWVAEAERDAQSSAEQTIREEQVGQVEEQPVEASEAVAEQLDELEAEVEEVLSIDAGAEEEEEETTADWAQAIPVEVEVAEAIQAEAAELELESVQETPEAGEEGTEAESEPTLVEEVAEEVTLEVPEAEPTTETEIQGWQEEEPAEVAEEPEALAEAEAEPAEELPDLPDWLSGVVEEEPSAEEAWTPPVPQYDLNSASLVEFERLPGIGFILAQQIVTYREQYGPFESVEDLLQIPGFDEELLGQVRDRLYTQPAPEAETEAGAQAEVEDVFAEEPAGWSAGGEGEAEAPESVRQARQALLEGEVQTAAEGYSRMIKERQSLDLVLQDLREAVHRFPADFDLWQALGDAELRAGNLSAALEAYSKAEEFLL